MARLLEKEAARRAQGDPQPSTLNPSTLTAGVRGVDAEHGHVRKVTAVILCGVVSPDPPYEAT